MKNMWKNRWKHNGIWATLWWKYMPGVEIEVKWPRFERADPNDYYRPWLEEFVGRQGWDWDWKIGNIEEDTLIIRFRRGRHHDAALVMLMWG